MDYLRQQNTDNIAVLPDIILLDLNMPCMGGKEFLETIKLDPGLRFIPVIMFTSSDAPADIRECYELHASSYIIKPFDIQQYTSTLNQIEKFWTDFVQLPPHATPQTRYSNPI